MTTLVVVNHPRDWPFEISGMRIVTAREYLTDPAYSENQSARVLNLCRTERYQGRGYYVSLLAEARGHRPLPEVKTLGDLQSSEPPDRLLPANFGESLQRALASNGESTFTLDAFFGRDPERQNDALAQQLFAVLRIPMLRAHFDRPHGRWRLRDLRILGVFDVQPGERPFIADSAREYMARSTRPRAKPPASGKASIAILYDDDEPEPPSNPAAIDKLCAAARDLGMRASIIGRDDIDRLPQFDGLFIRDTTNVNHYTYQFARRAAAEGLVVIDDPESILRCTNKVYLNELLSRHQVSVPRTVVVDREGAAARIEASLGFPCIVKEPDGAFSLGVEKVEGRAALEAVLAKYFERSALVLAQEWLPTSFDWRVGVLDGRPLFVCKYMMAPGHWQVVKRERGRKLEGATLAMPVGEAPEPVVRAAVRAATLIGDGLYGVDLKQVGDRCYVIEVNDNPNIDAGNEDSVLGEALYREVLGVFLRRIRDPASRAAA